VTALLTRVESVYDEEGIRCLALSGGVAANSELRATLTRWGKERAVDVRLADKALTSDNAAMIAWSVLLRPRRHGPDTPSSPARSRWPLGEGSAG
jgi:N6-L-threonylcarbamoyladenine synthase